MKFTYALNDLATIANEIITHCPYKIILFDAPMGVGKTTLIKEICKQLGVQDTISSPTYSLVNEYKGTDNIIYHFDFYRIQDEEEVYDIGYEEYIDTDAWIFIEWPQKITNLLPIHATQIQIDIQSDGKRVLFMR